MSYIRGVKIAIVILNWNGWKDTTELLNSLLNVDCAGLECHIVLIDNGSVDDSVSKLMEWFSKKSIRVLTVDEGYIRTQQCLGNIPRGETSPWRAVWFILNKANYGFAGGMNIGITFARRCLGADYVVLLNNDTIVDKNAILELYNVFKQYDRKDLRVGIVGPRVINYYTKRPVIIEQYLIPIPLASLLSKIFSNVAVTERHYEELRPLAVNRLDGSCFMVNSEVFEKIGLLNEDFFTYWEDTDFFVRARKSEYLIVLTPKAIIEHKIGSANIGTRKVNPRATYYFGRNAMLFIDLHYRGLTKILVKTIFLLISLYISFTYIFYYRSVKAFKFFILGVVKGLLKEKGKSRFLDKLS